MNKSFKRFKRTKYIVGATNPTYKTTDNIMFISDTHFEYSHKFKNRVEAILNTKFQTIEEAFEATIENWNSVVTEKTLVFIVGDFATKRKSQDMGQHIIINKYLKRLKGFKVLILGNHDDPNNIGMLSLDLSEHVDRMFGSYYFNIKNTDNKYRDMHCLMNHIPIHEYNISGTPKTYNIHGHTHSNDIFNTSHINVFCGKTDYKPIHISKIYEQMSIQSRTIEK